VSLAALLALGLLLVSSGPRPDQDEGPALDPSDIVDALLGGLMGLGEVSGSELQKEVAEVGGVPFRADVPLDFMTREELKTYLSELVDSEYPPARALSDQRTLVGLGLLEPGTDLRGIRARVLEENIAGFYDVRPGKKRLYAVSSNRRLSPSNQIILAHELRHALQDQYAKVDEALPESVGDFDDRRMALMSLLEGDATLVMERFLVSRMPGGEDLLGGDVSGMSLPAPPVSGAPPVVRDQLVLPYIAGRDFARALRKSGGWEALKKAWSHPPASTEQVLHPEKYASGEAPRPVSATYAPPGGTRLNEGVLGEMFIGTLLEDQGGAAAATGWGGDLYQAFDLSGRTLVVWRSVWDSPEDAARFFAAASRRLESDLGKPEVQHGFKVYSGRGWRFALGEWAGGVLWASSDDPEALDQTLVGATGKPRAAGRP
jgi:hypothetical protein